MREPPWIDYGPGYKSAWTVLAVIDSIWWAQETSEARRGTTPAKFFERTKDTQRQALAMLA